MAIELNNRTKLLAGVVVLAAAGAGAWFFFLDDFLNAPPPAAVVAKAAPKPAADAAKSAPAAAPKTADAAKPAAEAPTQADTAKPAADAAKPAAVAKAAAAPKPGAEPIPTNPDQLIAEVIETSGLKAYFQTFGREAMLKAGAGNEAQKQGMNPADFRAVVEIVDRVFAPAKMTAELAANLKGSNFDAERMARFLELLRQPIARKMTAQEMRSVTPEAMKEYTDSFRRNPPPAARIKLIQTLDEVTHSSEVGADMASAMARDMVDAMLDSMKKAGKNVPREARQMVGSQLNAMRNQSRAQIRSVMYVMYRKASDEELSEYVKLLDTDTGRWGSELLANAMRPVMVSRGSALGREVAQFTMAKQAAGKGSAAAQPAAQQEEKPAEQPAAAPVAAALEVPGYRRPANIREVYTRYNDLVSATVMRDSTAVRELLDDGKNPNARQRDGFTPLMIAASNGDTDIAGILLARGADPNLRTGGRSALSIARARGDVAMAQLLERSGARD